MNRHRTFFFWAAVVFLFFVVPAFLAGCATDWSYDAKKGTIRLGGVRPPSVGIRQGIEVGARAGVTYQAPSPIYEWVESHDFTYEIGGPAHPDHNIFKGTGGTQSGLTIENRRLKYKTTTRR